jgi:hypothetical protein
MQTEGFAAGTNFVNLRFLCHNQKRNVAYRNSQAGSVGLIARRKAQNVDS